jgi:hypothetical protein
MTFFYVDMEFTQQALHCIQFPSHICLGYLLNIWRQNAFTFYSLKGHFIQIILLHVKTSTHAHKILQLFQKKVLKLLTTCILLWKLSRRYYIDHHHHRWSSVLLLYSSNKDWICSIFLSDILGIFYLLVYNDTADSG